MQALWMVVLPAVTGECFDTMALVIVMYQCLGWWSSLGGYVVVIFIVFFVIKAIVKVILVIIL